MFGFVIGGTRRVAAAAELFTPAWDQCASDCYNSPAAFAIERVAERWVLEVLDLSCVGTVNFGTSASACGLACLTAALRRLLARLGWDFDHAWLAGGPEVRRSGGPEVRIMVSATAHVTVPKALRMMGVGLDRLRVVPSDAHGRADPRQLPSLDELTILCLQAGEVNTGRFAPFVPLIQRARAAGAWVHVDGAFGPWARANPGTRPPTEGLNGVQSWTTDGHKWLNTPYDSAMVICRNAEALPGAMSGDAAYAASAADRQKSLGIEFSRRARGVPIWAALRSLGRHGVARLVETHCRLALHLAEGLRATGLEVLNEVVPNRVLLVADTDAQTLAGPKAALAGGSPWFGTTRWPGRTAVRLSVSSWRTAAVDIDAAVQRLGAAYCA